MSLAARQEIVEDRFTTPPTMLRSLPLLAALAHLGAPAASPRPAVRPVRPTGQGAGDLAVYDGRRNQLHVTVPRLDAAVTVDGQLDEPAWAQAAVLTGFSQYSPQDGIPAADSTRVLVWYSPTALHVGIRAFESHGAAHATLADRDHIDADDNVQLLIGTFNDGRQATVFGVNPLGVQMDGTIVEQGNAAGGGFMAQTATRQAADLSQDYVFQSKGRVTDWGYEVEVRIPFKSLKYQSAEVQSWSFNVVRRVQHSNVEDSWAPARRASPSFVGQSGTLDGLTGLRRGLVLDVNPEVTQRTVGAARNSVAGDPASPTTWRYARDNPEFGGNVRWGMTNNLTVNATVNPDFSQVESDAGQFVFDPRSALYFPEKRPFFLEGMDGFATPNNLVYTRAIQQPVFATKLTGKKAGTSIAVLSAVDDRESSLKFVQTGGRDGYHPVFNIVRLQRDVGGQSRVGLTYTDKVDGGYSNRVADVDGRLVFARLYSLNFQGAASRTDQGAAAGARTGPLWMTSINRQGKRFAGRAIISGMSPDFIADAGFISRPGLVHTLVDPQFNAFGAGDALVQRFTFNPQYDLLWKYDYFTAGRDAIEKKLHLNFQGELRGGWSWGASVLLETFGYDPELYANYYVQRVQGAVTDTVAFTGTPRIPNRDWVVSVGTPSWKIFSLNALYLWGHDENFDEWASSNITYTTVSALVRPTDRLRIEPSYQLQTYDRPSSGELVRTARITRIKTEYQILRPLFFRLVGEYRTSEHLALRDESRTYGRLLYRNPDGSFTDFPAARRHVFRADWLLSYQPTPGTVFFAGYGSTSVPTAPTLTEMTESRYRSSDAFFVKASYLFRM